jgi:hypothetical protein
VGWRDARVLPGSGDRRTHRSSGPHHANVVDIQAQYGDVVSVVKVVEYLRKGLVEEAAE